MSKLQSTYRSDMLVHLRELFEKWPGSRELFGDVIQIQAIVDAEKVQEELRWRLGRRRNPRARSGFHEAIEAGLFVPIAPVYLKSEIEKHLDEIAVDTGATLEAARTEWKHVQASLLFYQPQSSPQDKYDAVDPHDLPYKYASNELGIPVYSKDAHFRAMKVPVISVCLNLTARDYVRSASVTLGVTLHSSITIAIAFEALGTLWRIIKGIVSLFMRLPKPLQWGIAGLAAGLLIHRKSRAKLVSGARVFYDSAVAIKPEVLSGLASLIEEFDKDLACFKHTRDQIRSALPSPQKRTALMHARAIFLMSKKPLSIPELETRIRTQGYFSRSCDFGKYLRRILRESEQFLEVSPGLWVLPGRDMAQ